MFYSLRILDLDSTSITLMQDGASHQKRSFVFERSFSRSWLLQMKSICKRGSFPITGFGVSRWDNRRLLLKVQVQKHQFVVVAESHFTFVEKVNSPDGQAHPLVGRVFLIHRGRIPIFLSVPLFFFDSLQLFLRLGLYLRLVLALQPFQKRAREIPVYRRRRIHPLSNLIVVVKSSQGLPFRGLLKVGDFSGEHDSLSCP